MAAEPLWEDEDAAPGLIPIGRQRPGVRSAVVRRFGPSPRQPGPSSIIHRSGDSDDCQKLTPYQWGLR